MRTACGLWVFFLCMTGCDPLENDPPSPPFVLDAGPTPIDAAGPIDAPVDAAIDATSTATHPPFPMPHACVPICLDGGA